MERMTAADSRHRSYPGDAITDSLDLILEIAERVRAGTLLEDDAARLTRACAVILDEMITELGRLEGELEKVRNLGRY